MSLERIRGVEPGQGSAVLRPAPAATTGPRAPVSTAEVRPLDTAAVLRVLIEEVRSSALDRLGFAPAAEREPFPVADRDRATAVLLRIMTAIAGDPRFQPDPGEDPVRLLQDVLRSGADHALNALARLPVAAGAPHALVEATRDAVAGSLVEPVRQRVVLGHAVQQALVVEIERELGGPRTSSPPASPGAAVRHGYSGPVAAPARPPLDVLFGQLAAARTKPESALPAPEDPTTLWTRIEAPVRAAFPASPEIDRVLAAVRERVFAAIAPRLAQAMPESGDRAAERFLDRLSNTLAAATGRPVSLPQSGVDGRAIAFAVIDTLRQVADAPPAAGRPAPPSVASVMDALRVLLAREVAPSTSAGGLVRAPAPAPAAAAVAEARVLLLRLLGSPEAAEVARHEPAAVVRWLTDAAASLARDLGVPYRLDLAAPRRRFGLRRGRLPPAGPEFEQDPEQDRERPIAAIESSPRRARSDEPRSRD
ncbi:MAG: hypothetical protein U1F14_08860 [Steroidobacteraceae bacterium]